MDTKPDNYFYWTVYSFERAWDISEKAKQNFNGEINKDDLVFGLMIRQPNFISDTIFSTILELTEKKNLHRLLDEIKLKKITEGRCIQMMHVGSYDTESESFEKMEKFADSQNLIRKSKVHREIYVSDFGKVPAEKLRTKIRFQLEN